MKKLAAAFLSLMFAASMAGAQSDDDWKTIIWVHTDFTPYSFIDGPSKGKGIIDQAIELLSKRLPEKKYEISAANNLRVFELMKTFPNVCTGVFFKNPEREKFMEFSAYPTVKILPNGVITTREKRDALKPYINENGELRLDAVLADGKYRLMVEAVRSFGPRIDAVIKSPDFKASVIRAKNASTLEDRLRAMVYQKEYDIVIGYAIELKSAVVRAKFKEEDFSFIPIAGEPLLLPVPVACSKSEIGRQYISAVDKVLAEPAVQHEIAQFYRHWLDNETALRYDKLLKQASASK